MCSDIASDDSKSDLGDHSAGQITTDIFIYLQSITLDIVTASDVKTFMFEVYTQS